MENWRPNYSPAEIADIFCDFLGETDEESEIYEDVADFFYSMYAICENEKNKDYYRVGMNCLNKMANKLDFYMSEIGGTL